MTTEKTAIDQLIEALNTPVPKDPNTGLDRLNEFLMYHLGDLRNIQTGNDDYLDEDTKEHLLRSYPTLLPFVGRIKIVEMSKESEYVPYWVVFELDGKTYRYDGVYSSWHDPDFSGQSIYETRKVQKTRVIVEESWDRVDTEDNTKN